MNRKNIILTQAYVISYGKWLVKSAI